MLLLFFVLHWYSSLFMQTFLPPPIRLSHSAFTMSDSGWVVSHHGFITQGSSYVSPGYTRSCTACTTPMLIHPRIPIHPNTTAIFHHDVAGTPGIVRDLFWQNSRGSAVSEESADWRALDLTGHATVTRLAWIAAYVAFYLVLLRPYWWFLLLPCISSWSRCTEPSSTGLPTNTAQSILK